MIGFFETVKKAALISECGKYRYRLSRIWDDSKYPIYWIMLNPSVADASVDDPTINRCCEFARTWKFGGIHVMNLFAYRATNPKELMRAEDPVGPENDECLKHLTKEQEETQFIVVAWGNKGSLFSRDVDVIEMFKGMVIHCLGMTKSGFPKHPLYVPGNTQLSPFWSS